MHLHSKSLVVVNAFVSLRHFILSLTSFHINGVLYVRFLISDVTAITAFLCVYFLKILFHWPSMSTPVPSNTTKQHTPAHVKCHVSFFCFVFPFYFPFFLFVLFLPLFRLLLCLKLKELACQSNTIPLDSNDGI